MLKGLFGRDALRGVIDEDFFEEVQELLQELRSRRDNVLELSQPSVDSTVGARELTRSFFMAFTNLLDARVVSGMG